MTSGGSI